MTPDEIVRCDVCGITTCDPHYPHNRGCPRVDCACDNVVCSGCCWQTDTHCAEAS